MTAEYDLRCDGTEPCAAVAKATTLGIQVVPVRFRGAASGIDAPGPDRAMTPRQRELARRALGLGGGRTMSYRNRFIAGPGHNDFGVWVEMVREGLAIRRDDLFLLTADGAHGALMPGDTLDPEDFP